MITVAETSVKPLELLSVLRRLGTTAHDGQGTLFSRSFMIRFYKEARLESATPFMNQPNPETWTEIIRFCARYVDQLAIEAKKNSSEITRQQGVGCEIAAEMLRKTADKFEARIKSRTLS